MNLGAFMDPEFPIFSTTLCYLEREDAYLMLHRIKKQDDYNHDKWVGVGGKFERFESPEDCLVREVREETGLTLTRYRARGLLTFVWGNMTEFIHLYTADRWEGEMIRGDACAEGELQWVQKSEVQKLPIWEGDKIFFRLLEEEHPYFSLKLVYDGDTLKQAVLDCWVSVKQFSKNDTATACQDWLRSTRLGRGSIKSHVRTVKVLGMGLFAFQERIHLWKGVTH